MLEFKINKFIILKLEDNETNIYINDKFFNLCKNLLINIPQSKLDNFDHINSIDEAENFYAEKHALKTNDILKITPEEEFIGHCSNLQAWAENNYITDILHSDIAFPLLKKLTEVGDLKARSVFKEEIVRRILVGYEPVIVYLIKAHFLELLKKEELLFLSEALDLNRRNTLTSIIIGELKENPHIKYKKALYRMFTILDEELAIDLPYVEYGEETVFVNDRLNLTRRRRDEYRIKTMLEIKGLNKLSQLKSLTIQDHSLSKISGLEQLVNLEFLDLSRNNIKNISGLNKCLKLKTLILHNNDIEEICNIERLNHLEYLDLRFNNINKINGLQHLTNLKRLALSRNKTAKIEGLDNLVNLQSLELMDNCISKIEGLDTLVNLLHLNLYGNENIKKLFKKFKHNGRLYVELSKRKNELF